MIGVRHLPAEDAPPVLFLVHVLHDLPALGDAAACRRNTRRRCGGPTPIVSASASTDFSSRNPRSISLSARETVAAAPRHAGVPGAVSGRQRKHGRNPARSAAAAVGKN